MKKNLENEMDDDLRPEYDIRKTFRDGERGKYAGQYRAGTNLILLDPDLAQAFPDDASVNNALRLVLELSKIPKEKSTH